MLRAGLSATSAIAQLPPPVHQRAGGQQLAGVCARRERVAEPRAASERSLPAPERKSRPRRRTGVGGSRRRRARARFGSLWLAKAAETAAGARGRQRGATEQSGGAGQTGGRRRLRAGSLFGRLRGSACNERRTEPAVARTPCTLLARRRSHEG